jgi:hypothetical protein
VNELTLVCETCAFPISGDTGCLYVRMADLAAYREEYKAWRAASDRDGAVTSAELMLLPLPVHWRTSHDKCRTDHDEDAYEIDAVRITSWAKAAHWTAHLMEKTWLASTDWKHLLRELSGEASSRRIRVVAREAA